MAVLVLWNSIHQEFWMAMTVNFLHGTEDLAISQAILAKNSGSVYQEYILPAETPKEEGHSSC